MAEASPSLRPNPVSIDPNVTALLNNERSGHHLSSPHRDAPITTRMSHKVTHSNPNGVEHKLNILQPSHTHSADDGVVSNAEPCDENGLPSVLRKPKGPTLSTQMLSMPSFSSDDSPSETISCDGISDDDAKALTLPPTRGLSIGKEAVVDDIKEDLSVKEDLSILDASEPKAITELREKALKGDADACYRLARHYRTGGEVSPSDTWAVYWYQQTVTFDEDHIEAWFNWGYMCEKGYGTPQNSQQAYVCWFKAANLDVTLALDDDEVRTCASANTNLGYLYQLGRGVDQSTDLATKCFLKAVRLGNIRAYYNLGALCSPGDRTGLVITQKALYYHYACEHGHIGSLYKIGKLYRHGSDNLRIWAMPLHKTA